MNPLPPVFPRATAMPPPPLPGLPPRELGGRWMHELRNELNTAMMAAAAARRLLQDGERDEALENVRRAEAACHRCAQLLRRDAAPPPH